MGWILATVGFFVIMAALCGVLAGVMAGVEWLATPREEKRATWALIKRQWWFSK